MLASSWYDMVMGLDIHLELPPPPAPPVPVPIPNVFVGVTVDGVGLAIGMAFSAVGTLFGASFAGPVVFWTAFPATNAGTDVKGMGHILMPPGIGWAPVPKVPAPVIDPTKTPGVDSPIAPANDAVVVMGSQTTDIMGSSATRLGDVALSCSEPMRIPFAFVVTIPKGAPILIGGPPSLSLADALLASLRCKFGADLLHSLVGTLKPGRLRDFLHRAVCSYTGHPVDVVSGRMMTEATDFTLTGPLPFAFERIYSSSASGRSSPLGHGWTHSLHEAIWEERGRVVYATGDGREIEFDVMDRRDRILHIGASVYCPHTQQTLRRTHRTQWEVTEPDGTVRRFASVPGRRDTETVAYLQAIRTRDGYHEISLSYDSRGNLDWVRDSGGRLVGFEHDMLGRLTLVKLPMPNERAWQVHRRYRYDSNGDLVAVEDSLGKSWKFAYVDHLMTQETDRTGLSFYFAYDGLGPSAYCIRTWGDGGIFDHVIDYDKAKKLSVVTNSLGHRTIYRANVVGLVVSIVDPLGGETKYEYDPLTLKKTKQTSPDGGETTWTFDALGRLLEEIGPSGATVRMTYEGVSRDLIGVEDALGGHHSFVVDQLGRTVQSTRPNGATKQHEWRDGLLVATVDSDRRRIEFDYDRAKNIATIRAPTGATTTFDWDGRGRIRRTRDPHGAITELRHDSENRTRSVVSPLGVGEELDYDAEGNLLEVRGANRHVRLEYTQFHRLALREEGGATLRFRYDTEDQLRVIENEAREHYVFERNERGDVLLERGFDGRAREYQRDKCGRIVGTKQPSGRKTKLAYDATGRLIEAIHDDGSFSRLSYRLDGALVSATNQDGEVQFERDRDGRIVRESANDAWVASRLGFHGERLFVESSLGAAMGVEYDQLGAVATLRLGASSNRIDSPSIGYVRDVTGLESARVAVAEGVRIDWERDLAGRPTSRRTHRTRPNASTTRSAPQELERRSYVWRDDDQLAAIIDPVRGPVFYDHDRRGRVVQERQKDRTVVRAIDDVGNVFRTNDRTDRRYGAGGRLEEADGVRYEHDEDGNRTSTTYPDGSRWEYRWNGHGLLAEIARHDGVFIRFSYDACARRTRKIVARCNADGSEVIERETRYVWDGHVVAHEVDSEQGVTTWYWEPETFTPVAKERGGHRWTIASDHLGTPTEMYDELGELAWKMQLDVFGVPTIDTGTPEDCPWRWPGQYEDSETGLYYNWFRYFDARDGQYVSPDPVGLLGGMSAFAYPVDPLISSDPLGWATNFQVGTFGTLTDAAANLGDGLDAHEMIRHAWLQDLEIAGTSRMAANPAVAVTRAMHQAIHAEETAIRLARGLPNNNSFAATLREELNIMALAMRRAGVPTGVVTALRREAAAFGKRVGCK